MQVTETLSDGLKRGYTVVVEAAEIEQRRSQKFADLGRTLRLPGFRPGKVPLPLVRQRFGREVSAEALQESVNAATSQMLSDRGLRPAGEPRVDLVSDAAAALGGTADVEFTIEMELLPEITLPDFAGLQLTRLTAEVPAEEVDKALGRIAERQAELVEVSETRPAEKGEVLTLDFQGRVEGTAFEGGTGTDMDVEVAGAGFIPGFTEQLVGMQVGETRTLSCAFPDDYQAKAVAGKPAEFEVTAKALKRKVLPPIDDELARKIGFDEGLEELRRVISDSIGREYAQMSRMHLKRQLLDALAGLASFPIPQGLADLEFNQIWRRIEADREAGRLDEADRAKDEASLREEYRAIADRRVRLGLLLSEIGRLNGITVAAEEMTRAMRAEAQRYPGQEAQVMEFFRKTPQAIEGLRGPLFEEKGVDFVIDQVQVSERVVSPEELAKEPESTGAAAG